MTHENYRKNQPYTYLIGWSNLDKWYYGCQYGIDANPTKLWSTYFTSSSVVKQFRKDYGEPDIVKVRRVFKSATQALKCEARVLRKVGAPKSDRWLNQSIGGEKFFMAGPRPDFSIRMKLKWSMGFERKSIKGIKRSAGFSANLSLHKIGNKNVVGKKWFNNGIENRRFVEAPNEAWVHGRLTIPWNKGQTGLQVGWNKGLTKHTNQSLLAVSKKMKGNKYGTANRGNKRPDLAERNRKKE